MPLYIYVTEYGDTLKKIADRYYCELDRLLLFNPYISNSDLSLAAGVQIKLPAPLLHMRRINDAAVSHSPEPSDTPLDQWIPLTSIEQMAKTDYDVLIIGSGAGGGAALWRLCEQWGQNGKKIGMIEAGDLLLPTHAFHVPTFDEQRALEYVDLVSDRIGEKWPNFRSAKIVRGLGGRTLIWYGWSPRFDPSAFKTWPITYKDLAPYYLIAEKIMNVTTQYNKGSSLQEILIERLLAGGFPEATDVPLATDLEGTKYGQVHSNVYFSSIDFLAYALNIRKYDLAVNTRAVQILTEKGKAAGVKVMTADKNTYTLTAKTIVVSASTWETPRLLLNSNIPGEAIGKYLVFHPVFHGFGTVNRDLFPEVLGSATVFVPGTAERNYQLQVFNDYWYDYKEIPLLEKYPLEVHGYGIVEPRADNFVSLDPIHRDAYGIPKLNVKFSFSDKDQVLLRELHASLSDFSAAAGLSLDGPLELQAPGADNHEAGTCRMGDNPATSVTDRFGQVHAVSGLYIADMSVLNLTSPSNPTLTAVALAIRTADHIAAQMK